MKNLKWNTWNISPSPLTINIQRLLCAVIKFHVVKKAIQSLSSLPFITNVNLFVNAKALTQGPKVGMAGVREA